MTSDEAIKYGEDWYAAIESRGDTAQSDALTFLAWAILALKERKTGKWFDNEDIYDKIAQKHDYFCLECKTHAMDFVCGSEDWWCCKPPKYCPNCGAKMEGVDDGDSN